MNAVGPVLCVLGLLVPAGYGFALASEEAERLEIVRPQPGKKIVPLGGMPESAADGATVYQNDHGPSSLEYFVLGTSPPRLPRWGEHVTLAPNSPAPLEIRSLEFSVNVTAAARLVAEFDIWDVYDTGASPVNSGLLRVEEVDYGPLSANASSLEFYDQLLLPFSSPLSLTDTSVFIEFRFKSDFGAVPANPAFRPVVDGDPSGPNLGTSENDLYVDQNGDDIFTFSAPNAGDRRVLHDTGTCGPSDCQSNYHLHIRGAPNPSVIEAGMDLWETPAGGSTFLDNDLAQGFFDLDDGGNSCVPSGFVTSDAMTAAMPLVGVPSGTLPSAALGPTDTIVVRQAPADLPLPGSFATVPIEIVALSLQSATPITVTYDGGASPTQWSVRVCLSGSPQTQGSMTITKGQCVGEGGTFASSLPVLPKLVFTQISPAPVPPCSGVITYDYGLEALPPFLFTSSGFWLPDAPPVMGLITAPTAGDQVDGNCDGSFETSLPATSPNFHPGVRIPRCASDPSCTSRPPVKRLTVEEALLAAHGVLPAEAPGPDLDLDQIPDPGDNCVSLPNPLQQDADEDGVGDACDQCPAACDPTQTDSDGDGRGDACDNCPGTSNSGQQDADGDQIGDVCDNCPQAGNPTQANSDGDTNGDACDNCPTVTNADQLNTDGDSFGDACDCDPSDPTNPTPGEVQGLRFAMPPPDKQTLTWVAVSGATVYDVVRGLLSALPVGPGLGDEICLASPVGTSALDPTLPDVGAGIWYLVRGENACGPTPDFGRFGSGANPTNFRVTTSCP